MILINFYFPLPIVILDEGRELFLPTALFLFTDLRVINIELRILHYIRDVKAIFFVAFFADSKRVHVSLVHRHLGHLCDVNELAGLAVRCDMFVTVSNVLIR